jgi:glutathione S-transferase
MQCLFLRPIRSAQVWCFEGRCGSRAARIRVPQADVHTKAIEGGGDYRTVNPLGYVPALLLDDGTLLTEGPAIVQWIADRVPSKRLAPANGTIERTKLQAWLNFFSSLDTRLQTHVVAVRLGILYRPPWLV